MVSDKWFHLKQYIRRSTTTSEIIHHPLNVMAGIYTLLRLPDVVHYQPEQIKVETTTRCNLACRFCGHTWGAMQSLGLKQLSENQPIPSDLLSACRRIGRHMDMHTFRRIIDQFPYLKRLDIQGMGEPLTNPDFSRILELSLQRKVQIQFFTNGTLMTNEMSRKIVDTGVSEISISLDGATAGSYELIRQGASFTKVVDNISYLCDYRRKLKKHFPIIRLAMVVTRHNVLEMPDLIDLAYSLGADQVVATQFKCIFPDLVSWTCSDDAIQAAVEESKERSKKYSLPFRVDFQVKDRSTATKQARHSAKSCFWPWFSINIDIDGYLTPCAYVPVHKGWGLGNVLETPFAQLWNSDRYRLLRSALKNQRLDGLVCENCRDM